MSTRSGKRIHGSFDDNDLKTEVAVIAKCERKTRNRRSKEKCDELNTTVPKLKKRDNYVTYPTDDETENQTIDSKEDGCLYAVNKDTLKDHNINNLLLKTIEHLNSIDEPKKSLRLTRRTKKFFDDPIKEKVIDKENGLLFEKQRKNKKSKKDNAKCTATENNNFDDNLVVKKKTKRKKKSGRRSNSDIAKEEQTMKIISSNVSNLSGDSFHSAAGSPVNEEPNHEYDNLIAGALSESSVNHSRTKNSITKNHNISFSKSIEDTSTKMNKSTSRNTTYDKIEVGDLKFLNSTFEKNCSSTDSNKSVIFNTTFEKELKGNKHKRLLRSNKTVGSVTPELIQESSIKSTKNEVSTLNSLDSTHNSGVANLDETFDNKIKAVKKQKLLMCKSFSDKAELEEPTENNIVKGNKLSTPNSLDTTYEKESNTNLDTSFGETNIKQKLLMQKCLRDTSELEEPTENILKSIKFSVQNSLDTTFEKQNNTKLNTTFDKTDIKEYSQCELPVDVDDSLKNVTFDKSTENLRFSITSNESKAENLNSSPLLIESSLDDSHLLKNPIKLAVIPESSTQSEVNAPRTPLKREGTFTKDSPEPIIFINSTNSIENTPTKRMSLPSPGWTPFHSQSIGSQKEKSIMNVTRSIEKSNRRSSLAELLPRATKVMFCSPVDNPFVSTQRKCKIVKSSLKGSSKSFVFDDSASSPVRPAGRKRSFTQNDVDEVRAKRKRLADDLQKSVDRLSRPRTSTVADKTIEPTTPVKNIPKPQSMSESKVNRTKMPNFAALHQKRFQKMESLEECQERKAKRARQMMTPVGSLMVLERSSPKGSDSPKLKAKAETPLKQKLPTLQSLRPGFTRFGFKLNTEGNPFILTNKPEEKPKDIKPNGVLKRQATQPSLTGATSSRKEVAKHAVMREKSSTCLKRDVNRKEFRTIIKGVRTNRRFELQMQSRNLNG